MRERLKLRERDREEGERCIEFGKEIIQVL
jgi:hypothetical protein